MAEAEENALALLPSDDEIALHNIASGIVELSRRVEEGMAISLPYPNTLQRGLDKLAAIKLQRGEIAPVGVPDLLASWCRRPLGTWGLVLKEGAIGDADRLLDGRRPTRICENWAIANPDVEAELEERKFVSALFALCQANPEKGMYATARRRLIEHPVLTSREYLALQSDLGSVDLGRRLAAAYEPVSQIHAHDGHFCCCKHCGNLLVRTDRDELACEDERCQSKGMLVGRKIGKADEVYWLRRGLRRYIGAPGRTELHLCAVVQKRQIECQLWPGDDAYDLRISLPGGEVWAVDVKDWANPFLLARQVRPFRTDPPWTHAFFVFPDERLKARPDYLRAFRQHCTVLNSRTEALFVRGFLRRLDKKIAEIR